MILRKPYAFLIKHFKLIHIILTVLLSYLAVRTYQLHDFVKYYLNEGWVERLNFKATTYVDLFIYLAIITAIIICTIILLLMKKKEKPTKFYVITIMFYFIIFLLFVFSYSTLVEMETKNLETRLISILADVNIVSFYAQLIVILFAAVRGSGFNFKKFNFAEDIEELNIEVNDREEVEVNFGVDTENFMTMIRRKRREFKYFYKENKFFINVFIVLVIFITGLSLFLNINVYNKIYKENETFRAGNFNKAITDVYVTKKDYKGRVITSSGESYLIVKMNVKNITNYDLSFVTSNYKLISGAAIYDPITKKYDSFVDFGIGYNDNVIAANSTNEYILVYLIDDRSLNNNLLIRYRNKIVYTIGDIMADYIKIAVTYEDIDEKEVKKYNGTITKEMFFEKSLLKDTSINIASYEIKDLFIYEYNYCINDDCENLQKIQDIIKPSSNSNYDKTIMAIDTSVILDDNVSKLTAFDIINKFGTISYTINGVVKIHNVDLINKTPINYKGSIIYVEVLEELKNATEISIVFNIRNNQYIYKLK